MPDDIEQRIRERAHQIWEEEGRPHGRDREHWERATREIAEAQANAAENRPPAEGSDKAALAH